MKVTILQHPDGTCTLTSQYPDQPPYSNHFDTLAAAQLYASAHWPSVEPDIIIWRQLSLWDLEKATP